MFDYADLSHLPIYGLAVWQAVETWRHGSLFRTARKFNRDRLLTHADWRVRKLGEGLNCPFCLSHWAAGLAAALAVLFATLPEFVSGCLWWAVYGLAVTRTAQIGNDVMKGTGWSQSPPGDVVVIDELEFVDRPGADSAPPPGF